MRAVRLTAAGASAAVLGANVLIIGALTPGYDQCADTVSRLGSPGQPYAVTARAGLALYGVLIIVATRAIGEAAPSNRRLVAGIVALYGLAAVVAGAAPKDAPGPRHTLMSEIHVAASIVGGSAVILAMAMTARGAPAVTDRRAAAMCLTLTLVGVVAFRLSWGAPFYGLVERGLLAVATCWIIRLFRPASPRMDCRRAAATRAGGPQPSQRRTVWT